MVHYLYMIHIFLKPNILSSIVSQISKSHITLNILSWIPPCSNSSFFLPKRILKIPNHFYLWQRYCLDPILWRTNCPYKSSTIFWKVKRELNKTIVQTLKEEIEGWTAKIARLKKLKNEHMKKRAMKNEGEPANKKIKGNLE